MSLKKGKGVASATSDVDIASAKNLGLFDDAELAEMMEGSQTNEEGYRITASGLIEMERELLKMQGSTPHPSSPSLQKLGEAPKSSFFSFGSGVSFKKKYVMIQGIQVTIFASKDEAKKPGSNPEKLIPLERCDRIGEVNAPEPSKGEVTYPFELVLGKKVITFAATNSQDRSLWIDLLNKAAEAAKKSGKVDLDLNEQQKQQMEKMKLYLPDSTGILDKDEITLVRFLRSRNFDLATSVGSFKESLRFRKVNGVSKLSISDVYHEAKRGLAYCLGSATDRKGHRIQILKAGAYSKLEKIDPRQAMKYLVYLRQKEVWEKGQKDILLVDLAGLNLNPVIMFVNRTYYYLMDYIFPTTTGLVIMFNTPWWIRAAWGVAKKLIDAEQRNIVLFLGSNLNLLKEMVGEESLPKEYGGTYTSYNHDEWIKDRFKIEGINFDKDALPPQTEDPQFMSDVFPDFDDASLDVTVSGMLKSSTKSGYLTKLGGNVHNWKKRFFVLKNGTLYYYKDEKPTTKPQGSIRLENDVNIRESEDPTKKGSTIGVSTAFEIVTPRRTYLIKANSSEERDDWCKVLTASKDK